MYLVHKYKESVNNQSGKGMSQVTLTLIVNLKTNVATEKKYINFRCMKNSLIQKHYLEAPPYFTACSLEMMFKFKT